jgi:H/ACA ribonucleoprotein complex subunit 3
MKIKYCPQCKAYTFKEKCPKCNSKTINQNPPKYSPEDKYGLWRRKIKMGQNGNKSI